eukprot:685439_1
MLAEQTDKSMLPPFTLDGNRFNLETYVGRTRNFFELFNPILLLTSNKRLDECKALLEDYKSNKFNTIDATLNTQLWDARRITDAIIHPQTNEKILLPFRMSCFVPMNFPIACGMLLTKSVPAALFWQWYNQSYNVAVNFCNGNKSNQLSNAKIAQAYCMAVAASCSVSYGLNKVLIASKARFSGSSYYLLSKTIPFTAVATAGALNVILMRYNEMKHGIDIMDKDGQIVGKSQVAGRYAVLQTALSRVVLPAPILLFPPYVVKALETTSFMKARPRLHLPLNIAVMTFFLWGALPCACGLFPQQSSLNINKLETEFHSLPMDIVWYNRGL